MALKYLTGNYANSFQLMRVGDNQQARMINAAETSLTQDQEPKLNYYSELLSTLPNGLTDKERHTLIKDHLKSDNSKLFYLLQNIEERIPKDEISSSKFKEDLKELGNYPFDKDQLRARIGFSRALEETINKYDVILNTTTEVVNAYRETNSYENNDEQVRQYAFNYYLDKSKNSKIEDGKIAGIMEKKWREIIIPLGLFILSIISVIAIFQPVGILNFTSNAGNILGVSSSNFGWSVFGISLAASFGSVKIIRDRIKKRENVNFAKKNAYINSNSVPDLVRKISGQILGAINPQKVFTNQDQGMKLYPQKLGNYLGSASNSKTMRNFAEEANKKIKEKIDSNPQEFYQKNSREVTQRYQTAIAQKTDELQRKLFKLQEEFYNRNLQQSASAKGGFEFKTDSRTNAIIDPYVNMLISFHEAHHQEVKQLKIQEAKELKIFDEAARKKDVPATAIPENQESKTAQEVIEKEYSDLEDQVKQIKEHCKQVGYANQNFDYFDNYLVNSGFFPGLLLSRQAQASDQILADPATSSDVPAQASTVLAPNPAASFAAPAQGGGQAERGGASLQARPIVPGQGRGADAPAQEGFGGAPRPARTLDSSQPSQTCNVAYPRICEFYNKITILFQDSSNDDKIFANDYWNSMESSNAYGSDIPNLKNADEAFEKNELNSNPNAPLYAVLFLEACRDNPDLQESFNELLKNDEDLKGSLYRALLETDPRHLGRTLNAFRDSPKRDDDLVYQIASDAYRYHSNLQASRSRQPDVASLPQGGSRAAESIPQGGGVQSQPREIGTFGGGPNDREFLPDPRSHTRSDAGLNQEGGGVAGSPEGPRRGGPLGEEAGSLQPPPVGARRGGEPKTWTNPRRMRDDLMGAPASTFTRPTDQTDEPRPVGGPRRRMVGQGSLPHLADLTPAPASPLARHGGGGRGQDGGS